MILQYTCIYCGKVVEKERSPASLVNGMPKFCSQKCHGLDKTKNKKGATPNFKGICENCGSEFETYRSPSNMKKGDPRFCSIKCIGEAQRGENNPSYNGGKHILNTGYEVLLMPHHPHCDVRGYILTHRYVMECKLGRLLTKKEVVHHIDEDITNNHPNNLELFKNQSTHMKHHAKQRNKF